MPGQLLTLPMRTGFSVARIFVRAGVSVATRTVSLVGGLVGGEQEHARESTRPTSPPTSRTAPQPPAARAAPTQTPAPSAPFAEPPAAEPVHVSEEPVLVEELAEPGAEDGAGANIVVDEPWEGYDELTAKDVIARMRGANSAALAAVELYERGHRRRRTVIDAVARELRSTNGSN